MLDPIKIQQQASDPNSSVWVMASAGSGKTKVLTDRILRLLLNDVEPQKILCLTYTKVASVEMQKRLYSELQKWATCDEIELIQKLSNLCGSKPNNYLITKARSLLIKNLDADFKIKIQTIHSFCKGILQSFPFEAKIPINFELIEENRAKILLKNCQKNILNHAIDDKIIRDIVIKINGQASDDTINELISKLLSKKDKIRQIKEKFSKIDDLTSEIYKKFNILEIPRDPENIIPQLFSNFLNSDIISKIKFIIQKLKSGGKNEYKSALEAQKFIDNPDFDNFEFLLDAFIVKSSNTPRKFSTKFCELWHKELDYIFHEIDRFNQQLQASIVIDNSINLLKIVDKVLYEFQQIKLENGFLDYADLINIANQILIDPKNCEWIKLKMDCSFDHLLVDEAQDTNPLQWSIIKALIDDFFSGESKSNNNRSVFIVGDEKQSIMGFQGADINKTKDFYDYLNYKSNQQLKNVDLNVSFRSGQNVLKLVDNIFNNEKFKNAICKIGSYQNHISYRSTVGYVEVWQYENDLIQQQNLNISTKNDAENLLKTLFKINNNDNNYKDLIAKLVSNQIAEWVKNQRLITDKNRPVEYGDIMILVRNRQNGLMEKLANNFTQIGIPFASVGKIKFSENLLIQDFMAIARFTLLQSDDFNLACLLKSPFFNYDDQQLLEICTQKNLHKTNLFDAITQNVDKENLQNLIIISKNYNCFDFFFVVLKNPVNTSNIVARFGEEAIEIINNFLFICQDFCQNNSPNLQNFLEFVEKIDPEISISNNQPNRVKITTIHSSKGLQAPIIIMPDCLYNYSKQADNREKIIWDDDFPFWISGKAKNNQQINQIYQGKIAQNYEEHLRLLYVALTRAEDEIYIGGLSKESDEKCWYKIINSLNDEFINKISINYNNLSLTKNNFTNNYIFDKTKYKFITPQLKYSQTNSSLIFGDYLHKALEIVGKNYFMSPEWLINFIQKYFQNYYLISPTICDEISTIVSNYLKSNIYQEIFDNNHSAQIHCEYEITHLKQRLRIDLLKINPQEILIIDYKSDEKIPDSIPLNYHHQIEQYQQAIRSAFPHHKIKSAILWIRFLKLDFITN